MLSPAINALLAPRAQVFRANNQTRRNQENLMNNESTGPRPKTASGSAKKVYFEFVLDPRTFEEVKELARRAHRTPFEMCVKLVREQITSRRPAART